MWKNIKRNFAKPIFLGRKVWFLLRMVQKDYALVTQIKGGKFTEPTMIIMVKNRNIVCLIKRESDMYRCLMMM